MPWPPFAAGLPSINALFCSLMRGNPFGPGLKCP